MKRTKRPTLDQVIRDAVSVQERIRRETGAIIEFHMTFQPAPEKQPKKRPAQTVSAGEEVK